MSGKIVDSFMKIIQIIPFFFLFYFSGCSSLKKVVEPPKVKLEDIRVGKLSLTNIELLVQLSVNNPNRVDFEIKNLKYILDINSKTVTTGTLKENVEVKGQANTLVTLPLKLKLSDIFDSALLLFNEGKIPYWVQGSADVGPFNINFNDTGSLNSSDLK